MASAARCPAIGHGRAATSAATIACLNESYAVLRERSWPPRLSVRVRETRRALSNDAAQHGVNAHVELPAASSAHEEDPAFYTSDDTRTDDDGCSSGPLGSRNFIIRRGGGRNASRPGCVLCLRKLRLTTAGPSLWVCWLGGASVAEGSRGTRSGTCYASTLTCAGSEVALPSPCVITSATQGC
eukprot:scaffold4851_cov428-Prasinococcus_capsulatus_cf.AAC.22